jgi:hypothetical protein
MIILKEAPLRAEVVGVIMHLYTYIFSGKKEKKVKVFRLN